MLSDSADGSASSSTTGQTKKWLRILHFYSTFSPDMGYIENYLPREEAKRGNAVVVVVQRQLVRAHARGPLEFLGTADSSRIGHESEPLIVGVSAFAFLDLARLVSRLKPDIVFLPYLNPVLPPILLLKNRIGYRVVTTIGMPVDIDAASPLRKSVYLVMRVLSKLVMEKRIDRFVESTPRNVQRDIDEFGISPERVTLIPLGADVREFRQDASMKEETRSRLGVQPDEVVFVYAGKLSPDKRIEMLIDAFRQVVEKVPLSRLLLIGNGDARYVEKLDERIRANGVADCTIRLNLSPHKDLPRYYNAADIGVWPGSPSITIQEAMACGLPIVISRSGHTQHLLRYGNGYDFESLIELSGHLLNLAEDHLRRQYMGEMSRKLACDELDWSRITDRFVSLYNIAVAERDTDE